MIYSIKGAIVLALLGILAMCFYTYEMNHTHGTIGDNFADGFYAGLHDGMRK